MVGVFEVLFVDVGDFVVLVDLVDLSVWVVPGTVSGILL